MTTQDPTGGTLQSKWDGLSRVLLATIYPVNAQGYRDAGSTVAGPLSDGTLELSANWQSPFEQSGPESKIPSIMNMAQSGTLESYASTLLGRGGEDGAWRANLANEIAEVSRSAQGRSGMTKLNSTQLFTGAPPVRVPLTIHFRAFDDPAAEVEAPIAQLSKWVLARELAPSGTLVSAVESLKNGQGFLAALMPSKAPQMVGFTYGGHTMSPMVIESVSRPITVPRASDGAMLHVAVQVQLATLTALDQADWGLVRSGQPIRLFNNQ